MNTFQNLTAGERERFAWISGTANQPFAELDDTHTEAESNLNAACELQATIDGIRRRFDEVLEFVNTMHDIIDELDEIDRGPCRAALAACQIGRAHVCTP